MKHYMTRTRNSDFAQQNFKTRVHSMLAPIISFFGYNDRYPQPQFRDKGSCIEETREGLAVVSPRSGRKQI